MKLKQVENHIEARAKQERFNKRTPKNLKKRSGCEAVENHNELRENSNEMRELQKIEQVMNRLRTDKKSPI